MENVKQLQKKYGTTAMLVAIILALVLISAGQKELAKGLVLGTLFSVINFMLMGESLQLRLGRTRRAGTVVSFGLIVLRFSLLAIPLIVSIRYHQYHIVTTITGLFMVQAVILTDAARQIMRSRQV
jgi:hypothetical protein